MMDIRIEKTTCPKAKPDWSHLGFGHIFTDHMFIMNYTEGQGWRRRACRPVPELLA